MENAQSTASVGTDPIAARPKTSDQLPTVPGIPAETSPDAQMAPTRPADPSTEAGSAGPVATDRPRRALKVVLRLQPAAEPGYRVLLAVGAEGCDPLYRSLDVDDLPTALDAIPVLVADAEERWQHAPHYPTLAKPRPAAPDRSPAPTASATGPSTTSVPPARPSPSKPAPTDQLPLF